VRKAAWIRRGIYLCAGYIREPHEARAKDVVVDHIDPVVPLTGVVSWDDTIKRMFVEIDGLQVLCRTCHNKKTKDERQRRK